MSNSALHRLSNLHGACGMSCSPFLLQVFLTTKQHYTQPHHTHTHTHTYIKKRKKESKEPDPSFLFLPSMIAACAPLILWHSCRSLKLITYSFSFFASLLPAFRIQKARSVAAAADRVADARWRERWCVLGSPSASRLYCQGLVAGGSNCNLHDGNPKCLPLTY